MVFTLAYGGGDSCFWWYYEPWVITWNMYSDAACTNLIHSGEAGIEVDLWIDETNVYVWVHFYVGYGYGAGEVTLFYTTWPRGADCAGSWGPIAGPTLGECGTLVGGGYCVGYGATVAVEMVVPE